MRFRGDEGHTRRDHIVTGRIKNEARFIAGGKPPHHIRTEIKVHVDIGEIKQGHDRRSGGNHLTRFAQPVFNATTNGRANDQVIKRNTNLRHLGFRRRNQRIRATDLRLCGGKRRLRHMKAVTGIFQRGVRGHLPAIELHDTVVTGLGQRQRAFRLHHGSQGLLLRGFRLQDRGLGTQKLGLHVAVIDPGNHGIGLDHIALVNQNLDQTPGIFPGHINRLRLDPAIGIGKARVIRRATKAIDERIKQRLCP